MGTNYAKGQMSFAVNQSDPLKMLILEFFWLGQKSANFKKHL